MARHVVSPGHRLWRVHAHDSRADEFPARRASRYSGGRFDSDDGSYASMYVSARPVTALTEHLIRSQKFTSAGRRTLARKQVDGKALSPLRAAGELTLLRLLSGQDLAAVGLRDDRLLRCGADEFGKTRRWAHQIRDRMPSIQGIIWPSTQDIPEHTMVLFGDRCPRGSISALSDSARRLDDDAGASWLNGVLEPYGVQIRPPARLDLPVVFINYRSADDTHAALLLDDELRARLGDSAVFRDNRSIRPGADFPRELIEKVRGAKVLLALIGCRWDATYDDRGRRALDNPADWVRREITEALAHRLRIVPVLLGARGIPTADSLPEEIRKLADFQFLHLRRGYTERDVKVLVDELLEIVQIQPRFAAATPAANRLSTPSAV